MKKNETDEKNQEPEQSREPEIVEKEHQEFQAIPVIFEDGFIGYLVR